MNGAVNQLPEFGSDDFEKCCIISEKRNFALLVIFSSILVNIFSNYRK